MNYDVNKIFSLLEKNDFLPALEVCEEMISCSMTDFMENLTVNTATDYVGTVVLYAQICGAIKKPWKAFPKLEAARGGLRFLKDYMTDQATLAETFFSVAEAYAYGGFLPEAVHFFRESARFSEDDQKAEDAIFSAFFYEARFGKPIFGDHAFLYEKYGSQKIEEWKKRALSEAAKQICTDPVESADEFLEHRFAAEQETDALLSKISQEGTPFCVLYWNTKKSVLKEKFGIDWKTPEEMNPNIRFY